MRQFLSGSVALIALFSLAPRAFAETLTITSTPPGATVEIDGSPVGKTPFQSDFPGAYFHKPHTSFGTRLKHSMVARISMKGYVAQDVKLTDGPLVWVAVTGRHHGNYWVFKTNHFEVQLEPTYKLEGGSFENSERPGPLPPYRGPARPGSEGAARETGSVAITSDPAGAEIYIDGKFMGQAPATLHLAIGSHHVIVKAIGKKDWERTLEVLKDSQLTLHPVLEQQP
ncbi:MAG: PEGA domain-containing protein [Candidatus Acidiferrales bacterium]